MIFKGFPGGAQVEVRHPVEGRKDGPWPTVNSYQTQIADLQTVKSRYQTGELAIADCRTGNDWKT